MIFARIDSVEYHLPKAILSNEILENQFEGFPADKIYAKTGIHEHRLAENGECSSDLAAFAVERLFSRGSVAPDGVEALIFCTQTPDYFTRPNACILQERLGLPTNTAAFDVNLGCSGYVYCLGLAKGLIETGQAGNVIIVTADIYSRMLSPEDRDVRSIFGNAAAATLVRCFPGEAPLIGPFVYGTDGRGAKKPIAEGGAFRRPDLSPILFMDGPGVFHFTLETVPRVARQLLESCNKTIDQVDLFVFHQANRLMLDHLREKMGIPDEKFIVVMDLCGNTVSSSIPIALRKAQQQNTLSEGMTIMLVGFGVGFSWGATLIQWNG